MREEIKIRLLKDYLSSALGNAYSVDTEVRVGQMQRRADLVVSHKHRRKLFIIEYKGYKKSMSLPIHAILQLFFYGEENKELQPHLILATTGTVGMLARHEAASKDISLVQADELQEVATELAKVIEDRTNDALEPM